MKPAHSSSSPHADDSVRCRLANVASNKATLEVAYNARRVSYDDAGALMIGEAPRRLLALGQAAVAAVRLCD